MATESPSIAWWISKGSFAYAAREGIASSTRISPPAKRLVTSVASEAARLYVNLGDPKLSFGNPLHPLFERVAEESGKFASSYEELYDPIHERARDAIARISDTGTRSKAMSDLTIVERVARHMTGTPVTVYYGRLGSEFAVYRVALPSPIS